MVNTMKILHTLTLVMFSVSFYKICVESDTAPSSNSGALTVVPNQENDEDDGVTVSEEPSEIEYSDEVFYPTKEWQKVKKGQAVPSGLHVRLNLETGEKEAKLMEGDDGMKYWREGDRQGMVNPKNKFFSRDELKQALKDFKAEAVDEETTRRREESVRKKFKKYEDLKKDLASMNMDIKTDGEIITTLVERLKQTNTEIREKHNTLTNLEFYLHQIDNAVMFCDLGGMAPLVSLLNHTHKELRAEAAFVLGSATQSNPKVQVQAMETGSLPQLIRLLSTDENMTVRKRVLFSISSLIRQFPYAQQKFLQLGGLAALAQLFSEKGTEKLQLKAITLLHDLLLEQEHVKEMNPEESSVKLRIEQYKEVPLLETMIEKGWCDLIPRLLDASEHDVREKVLQAMVSLREPCKHSFSRSFHRLQKLQAEYQELAKEEKIDGADDDYFTNLLNSVNSVIVKMAEKEEL